MHNSPTGEHPPFLSGNTDSWCFASVLLSWLQSGDSGERVWEPGSSVTGTKVIPIVQVTDDGERGG